LHRVTRAQAFAGSPTWSPDGKHLALFEMDLAELENIGAIRRQRGTTQIGISLVRKPGLLATTRLAA